jgi:hypothetical protein
MFIYIYIHIYTYVYIYISLLSLLDGEGVYGSRIIVMPTKIAA